MTTQATMQNLEARSKRRGVLLLVLALGAALAALVAVVGATAREAEATVTATNGRIVFASDRTGAGVDNPTGDWEIFTIKPDGTGLKQLTFNTADEFSPVFSPDGTKIAYDSQGDSTSNPQGDYEIYVMNATDGSGKQNLTNNGYDVNDYSPVFSPDGQKIAYVSRGVQTTNPGGDFDIYVMNATDGSGQMNLSWTASGVQEDLPVFSPDSKWVAYQSTGAQPSNPQGDSEIYRANVSDGTGQINLTNNGYDVNDYSAVFSPDGTRIAYASSGKQTSNSQGDTEVYRMSATDGSRKKNLSNNGSGVADYGPDFSLGGKKVAYQSEGKQTSNSQGDAEVYRMSATDGSLKKNLSNNGSGVADYAPAFSPDGNQISYASSGKQTSNSQGDWEVYRMSATDGSLKKNVSNNDAGDFNPDWGRRAT